jgi:DNA repair exonuclease SbcCD ATPase subunit
MIEEITIINFQIHKKLHFTLDPEITCVTGPTNSGKSSIVRAIRWLFFNRPTGNSYIHRQLSDGSRHRQTVERNERASNKKTELGKTICKVTCNLDGNVIGRCKGPGQNTYKRNGRTLSAIGSGIPGSISNRS